MRRKYTLCLLSMGVTGFGAIFGAAIGDWSFALANLATMFASASHATTLRDLEDRPWSAP